MKAKFRIYFDDLSAYIYSGTDLYIEFRDCEDILYLRYFPRRKESLFCWMSLLKYVSYLFVDMLELFV